MNGSLRNCILSGKINTSALLDQVRKERAERSLAEFIRQAWAVLEHNTPYVHNWHIDLIAEYLQAVNDGEIHRLLINMPPRHMKSIEATVCYPVRTWTRHPEKRFIKVSYSDSLSRDLNIRSRDIILSEWYQANWGSVFSLKDDVNRQNEFQNDRMGLMLSTSTGSSLTGKGGDVIIIDNPQNPDMADSDAERQNTIDFFRGTLQTRLNNPKTGAFIVIMQRLHENDLSGYILSENLGYTHLCLPAEAPERVVIRFPKSGREIIREEGDILNPGRFDEEVLAQSKKAMGSERYAGQFQQVPAPAEGIIFRREWLSKNPPFHMRSLPYMNTLIQSWDMAFTKSESSAKVAGFVLGRAGSAIYVLDLVNDKMDFVESVAAVRSLSGKRRIQEIEGISIEHDLAGLPVITAPPNVDVWDVKDPDNAERYAALKALVQGIRRDQSEGVVLNNEYKLELMTSGGARQFDTNAIINRYDSRMAMTVLADFILLGHQKVGSFALSSDKTELFAMAIGAYLDIICEEFNNKAIPALIDINGNHFKGITDYPRLTHGDIEDPNLTEVSAFIKDMTGIGVLMPDDELEDYIRRVGHLPTRVERVRGQEDESRRQARTGNAPSNDGEPPDDEIR